ncbi:hypothetical protein FBU59_002236 [Linderina macrospora]|uniref:Uncharacterized protein n=1 Tax=Linderina macrospora TaxID=4868 RepID=A0ACC1JC19_9FUNG|nr:hypothetical protein FBU59_002236 [Linderina macrospora]
MVPHIPFRWLNYRHFAEEVWIRSNQIQFCGKDGETAKCSDLVPLANYSIPDHSRYPVTNWAGASNYQP